MKFTGAGINRTIWAVPLGNGPGVTTSSVRFFANPNQGYQIGFAYGALVNFGNENSDSYILPQARFFRLLYPLHSGVSAPEADSA